MPQVWRKRCATALMVLALGLVLTCALTSSRWIGSSFPGFFIIANRVIASASLPYWPVANNNHIYQHAVLAMNGQPVTSPEDLYASVRTLPPGSSLTYTLEKDGQTLEITLPSLTFTFKDYCLLFAAYLFNGLIIAFIGIGVWGFKATTPASRALLILGLAGGAFATTAGDLYSPYWFIRLHVVGEAFVPAAFIHLALVFPVDRLRRFRSFFFLLPYLLSLCLAAAYELFLYQPSAYSLIHGLCMVYIGIGSLALWGTILWNYWSTASLLVRQRIRIILLGCFSGYAYPGILMFLSGVSGGEVAINYAAFTAFLFPLSLAYASVKDDPFEIDTMVKRGISSLTLITIIMLSLT